MIYKETTPPLWIVGGTPDEIAQIRLQLSDTISNLQYFEKIQKIIWWGYLNAEGISTLLLKTLVLITHSKFEAGGRVIIEAMSSGTPVIATPTGFGMDYINDWTNGFLVPYSHVDFLTHRMRHFINQPLLSNSLGNTASLMYKRIKDKFNCYEKHLIIYNNVINNEKKPLLEYNANILSSVNKELSIGRLTTYPYETTNNNQNYIEKLIKANFNFSYNIIKRIKNNIWLATDDKRKYVIKKLYSKINLEKIWCLSATPLAFTPQMQLDIVINKCSEYAPCIPVYDFCNVNYVIVIEFCHSSSARWEFPKLLECILKQKKTHHIPNGKVITRESVLKELDDASKNKLSLQWCQIWSNIKNQFKNHLKLDKEISNLGYCYGKSYIEHAVEYNEGIYLLPSDTIFIAEWGYDYAELLTDFFTARDWDIDQYIKAYRMTLKIIAIENDIFLPLCLCSIAMKLMKNTVLLYSHEDRLLKLIWHLMDL